jgi:hypothetical protein
MDLETNLKGCARALARRVLCSDLAWSILRGAASRSSYLRVQRKAATEARFRERCEHAFVRMVVLSGPFAGLKYPTEVSHGSAFYPKLLGSYEAELHEALHQFCGRSYDGIVDIGFAEGYYLVGLARLFPTVKLWGFDISPQAHTLCRELARANGIDPARLNLGDSADPASLRRAIKGRTLVICDCEGFEVELFAPRNEAIWERADLIIECHDFIHPEATASVRRQLERTHNIKLISSTEPVLNKNLVSEDICVMFSEDELLRLLNEGRPCQQYWIVASPRTEIRSTHVSSAARNGLPGGRTA